jgi:hypothetical protein
MVCGLFMHSEFCERPAGPGEALDVGFAWAGHPVGFALLTCGSRQFVAYYDQDRVMTVASRRIHESEWRKVSLPQQVGWDSHNSIVLAEDDLGYLHLSGNMHADPLVYFRTREPWDIGTFESVGRMTGKQEDLVTYPMFFRGPQGELCFGYRHGSSGRGDQIYNRYDSRRREWTSLSSGSIISGEGVRNAYLDGPKRGVDGRFHVCWVWRDDPDAGTNHDVCYARSSDLVHWENSRGEPLDLPITYDTGEIVDPVPVGAGLMNGNTRLGFDGAGNPVISYHKLDERGFTQVFVARHRHGTWERKQVTAWPGAWLASGTGSIPYPIRVHPIRPDGCGRLIQRYWHEDQGDVNLILDSETLTPVGQTGNLDPAMVRWRTPAEGRRVNWSRDRGECNGIAAPYILRWESLEANRDKARNEVVEPEMLRVIRGGNDILF